MNRAILYTRVSTLDQAREGVSLEAQRARAESWAATHGYVIAGTFSDPGISGKRADNRPGLQNALAAVCEARGALVVYSLSRLARSVQDALAIVARLEKCGADLVSLTESIDTTTAAGRMMFTVFAAFAAFERELTAERTSAALQHLKRSGRAYGEVPYGKRRDGGQLVDDAAEATLRARMRDLRLDGKSWTEIAETLNQEHLPTKKGRQWSAQNARKMALQCSSSAG
jgi:site-specific DNA recombinase